VADKPVADALHKRLIAEELKRLARTRWLDRLTSLWAPISIFGIAFSIYLIIVEFSVCAYPPLQPWLQGFGLIMLAYYFGLVAMRVVARPFINARSERNATEELLAEVEALATKNAAALGAKKIDELADRMAGVAKALGTRDPRELKETTAQLSEAADKHLKKFKRGSPADFASGFVKALLVALLIRSVLVEPFKIPSGSMIPTLEIGDQIFVNKFIYGVRVPFLDAVPFVIVREPKRGDVIVFYNRLVGKDFIKRVIAVPGDTVEMHGSKVIVNGQELPAQLENANYLHWEQYTPVDRPIADSLKMWFVNDWQQTSAVLSRETIGTQQHYILQASMPRESQFSVTVPAKSVFVMGDNRDNSEDSRFGLGCSSAGTCPGPNPLFVPYDDIKGKATVIWLSLSHAGLFDSIFGGTGIRGDRFFRSVSMCGNEPVRR